MKIQEGDIIRFKGCEVGRDWVAIHFTKCNVNGRKMKFFHRKHIKNYTGFYLYSGLYYEGDALTCDVWGKTLGSLDVGMFPRIKIVGNITNKKDFQQIKEFGKIIRQNDKTNIQNQSRA